MSRHRRNRYSRITLRTVSSDPDDNTRPLRLACYGALFHIQHTPQPEPVFAAAIVTILKRAIRSGGEL